ncbi:MAG: hypothetical protein GWN94_01395 [Phycisphaerae bacterium]|nr:hypothetical protein [Phycisphaerae bacterium]
MKKSVSGRLNRLIGPQNEKNVDNPESNLVILIGWSFYEQRKIVMQQEGNLGKNTRFAF